MPLPVAINGTISLQGPTRQGDTPQPLTKRAMIIRMSEDTLEALAAYPAHPPLQFEFGDTPGIHIESTFFPMRGVQESTPHELYLRSALASKINAPLKLYADIAGKFTVERELNGKTQSKVQQSTADAQKTKTERRIVVLANPPTLTASSTKSKSSAPPKKRKPAVSAPIAATVKRVPHVVRVKYEGSSAARGQSPPHSLPSSQSSPVPPAMRAQMIHLLAKGPRTKEDVLSQLGSPHAVETLRVQLNELLVTIAERERPTSRTAVPGQASLYVLLPESWKEVRPYEFPGLTDDERRKMWRKARQCLHDMGIPESNAAWDHVRTLPGSTVTNSLKVGPGPKRSIGPVPAERKKNTGNTSKAPIEAKDEGVRPSHTANVREEVIQAPRPAKAAPRREEDDPSPRRLPGTSGPKGTREAAPPQSQSSQAQGPSKKVGLTDPRAKHGDSSKPNGRPSIPTAIQPSSSQERGLEREEKPPHAMKRQRDDGSDLDREKVKPTPVPKVKRPKDDASDLEGLRDWDVGGKANPKRKRLREDRDEKDVINGPGTGNPVKRRKVTDDDAPYKPGASSGRAKVRERDRDKESGRGQDKTRSRDPPPVAKRPRDSDRGSPDTSLVSRKSTVRERERQRERETDRSVSPPRRVKREPSLSPALHNTHLRESSPLSRGSTKRRSDSPPREPVKREGSPRPTLHSRRGDSPLSAPRTSKRAPSPLNSQTRARGRDRESSANGGSSTRRRRSPIYTSSEDEHSSAPPVRRNAPSPVTSSSSSREPPRPQSYASHPPLPPTAPYPKDREALQKRYRSGYRSYFTVYSRLLEEREKIEDALNDVGREGSACSDRDVEMMDEEGLRELASQYAAWTRELEGIRNAYSTEAERMDIAT